MVSATLRTIKSAGILVLVAGVGLSTSSAFAKKLPAKNKTTSSDSQQSLSQDSGASSGESLKFNTDSAPTPTDPRPSMTFKDPGAAQLGQPAPVYNSIPEEEPFKTYIGYPKHQLGAYVMPTSLSSTWKHAPNSYSFKDSPLHYGVNYRLIVTPQWDMEVDYNRATAHMTAATVSSLRFLDSKVDLDNYFYRVNACIIGNSGFFHRLCPGFEIGNDSYTVLKFATSSSLALSKFQDIMVGLNLRYSVPFSDAFLFKTTVGYDYGTGLGNAGVFTSKGNMSYFGKADLEYSIHDHHTVTAGLNIKARHAKVEGTVTSTVGSITDTWSTDSVTFGGQFGYLYTF